MSDVMARLTTALESRYRVAREIGVGGMATVYLAHDHRHERDVAIKVLHPDLAAALGAERFLAEIKTTAKLQHPHILPLLDSGEADGLLYYVMPYVAGESLRTRLERETQLAVDDAIRIAREVASALESAHKHGVVHRDIKPENILLHEEQALVADFGIALAVSAAGGPRMTQTGLSLGTPAYMAPEQAMGERVIDGRADIYALGAVLYEMLVGEAPFTGPSVQAIVARVMTEQPRAVTGQRRSVPEHVNAAVMRALEKLPADRFHSAAEFSKALVTPGFETARATSALLSVGKAKRSVGSLGDLLPWSIAGLALLSAVVFAVRTATSKPELPPMYLSVDLPPGMELDPLNGAVVGISEDGSTLAVGVVGGGRSQIILRNLSKDETRVLQGSTGALGSAEFSPDGRWIAFNADEKLSKTPVGGGPVTPLAWSHWAHIAWAGNDAIIFTKNYNTGLSRISSEGRDSAELTSPDRGKGELGNWWPQVLPDGEHVLFTTFKTPADKSSIEVISLRTRERRVVLEGGFFGRYASGRLIFARGSAVMSVPFDSRAMKVEGTPATLPLDVEINPTNGWAGFAVSRNGTLVYRNDPDTRVDLVWVDEGGNEEPAIAEAGRYTDAVPSPDGRRIAVIRDGDVWVYDRERQLFSRLTRTEQREGGIVWSPDGRDVFYVRDVPQFDIFRRAADGSGREELIITSGTDKSPTSVSRDGKLLIYQNDDAENDIYAVPLDSGERGSPQRIIDGAGNQDNARLSPDGMWVMYTSNESGRNEIYLAPFPVNRGPARQQLSVDGGDDALWGPDGRTVYFTWSNRINRVRVNPRTGEIGKPELLARVPAVLNWDIAPDGRFIIGKRAGNGARHSVKVVLNWPSMLDGAK